MANRNRFTVEQVVDALRHTKGMKGPAARRLGCSWNTVDNYSKRHTKVAEAIAEEREMMLDVGELSLARAVQNGESWAVCFLLKTQGKERGYVERQEVTGEGGGAVKTELTLKSETVNMLNGLAEHKATNGNHA